MNNPTLFLLASVATYAMRSGCDGPELHMAATDISDPVLSGRQFEAVCRVGERGGDGTLIAPEWVLTAGHVADGMHARSKGNLAVHFEGGQVYAVRQVFLHPRYEPMGRYDLALLRLEQPVSGVEPLSRFTGSDELGRPIVIAGHGDRRNPDGTWVRDGQLRAYTNLIDAVDDTQILFDYDAPGAGATAQEGTSGPGDSGGPAMIVTAQGHLVAGVSSMGEPGAEGPCSYGAVEHFVRISRFREWIDGVMRDPEAHAALEPPVGPATTGPGSPPATSILGGSAREQAAQRIVEALASGATKELELAIMDTYDPDILARRDAPAIIGTMPALVAQLSGARMERVISRSDERISLRMVNKGHRYGLDLFYRPSGKIEQMAFGSME